MPPTPPFVLIDDARATREADGAWLFSNPQNVIQCDRTEDAPKALSAIDDAIAAGAYVAGFLSYELGYALEPKLSPLMPDDRTTPLLWMGVFDAPQRLNETALESQLEAWGQDTAEVALEAPPIERQTYLQNVEKIRAHIASGDVYQINYTFPQPLRITGSPAALYARLRLRQRAGYGALVDTGQKRIVSLSPELFFAVRDDTIKSAPMKGTAARKPRPEDDEATARWLQGDEKSRAENLMIVDLLRNDIGRVAQVGSVSVGSLFDVETYPTVHQMTSTIEARLNSGAPFSSVMRALFPCGSVTGAPKVKAMEIIRDLECAPRGVYTGAVGFAGPGEARFNVAIRTLEFDTQGRGVLGIGSGIVYDSTPSEEWAECHLKARFLTDSHPPFALLETLKWSAGEGFALLDHHLRRLKRTASYFCFPYDEAAVREALDQAVEDAAGPMRLRLTVSAQGACAVHCTPLREMSEDGRAWRYAIAPAPIDVHSPFTYHKTTNRAFYDDAREAVQAETGADEVLFLNDRGELTEGSITNLFIERDGVLLTPPVSCGLLAGTLRESLLESGRAREAVLKPQDLIDADAVYLGNSVRGLIAAHPFDV